MKYVILYVFSVLAVFPGFTQEDNETITSVRLNSSTFAANSQNPSYSRSMVSPHYWLNVIDNDYSTFWAVKNEKIPDYGILVLEQAINVDSIKVYHGDYQKDEFQRKNRVKKLLIEYESESFIADFNDTPKAQEIRFSKKVKAKNWKFTILDVYPGTAENITCIAEIDFFINDKIIQIESTFSALKKEYEENNKNLTPHGKKIVEMTMAGNIVSFFFEDGTFIRIQNTYSFGKSAYKEKVMGSWNFLENGDIEVEYKLKCYPKGIGVPIIKPHEDYPGYESISYSEWEYVTEKINEQERKITWWHSTVEYAIKNKDSFFSTLGYISLDEQHIKKTGDVSEFGSYLTNAQTRPAPK